MRRPLIAANWKMYKTREEAFDFLTEWDQVNPHSQEVDVVICPPFTSLVTLCKRQTILGYRVGAQNMHEADEGAYTGEISASMLTDVGCSYVILGHSERRQLFAETNLSIRNKLHQAFRAQLSPIFCIGETFEQKQTNQTEAVLLKQLTEGLTDISPSQDLVIAYEPVWAIGTGQVATPEQAQAMHHWIRATLAKLWNETTAAQIRILYGGSVKPENAQELLAQPDIDGALIGGASLKAPSFAQIVQHAHHLQLQFGGPSRA